MTKKKILITGSHGFVGKHLVKKLAELGIEVVEVDILTGIDLTNYENLEQLEKVDIVIHLAAKTFVPFAYESPRLVYKANILGTLNILEYCRNNEVNKIIYVSSYVYGEPEYLPIDEAHKTNIKNPYGRSKLIGEQLCINYFEDYSIIPLIFRPFNIYGPGQNLNFLIPSIVKQVLENNKVIVEDLTPKRDFIYIDDVIDIFALAIQHYNFRKPEIFNLGIGKSYSVKEVIEIAMDIVGCKKEIKISPKERISEITDCFADISKVSKTFSWKPEYDLQKGLERMISLIKNV